MNSMAPRKRTSSGGTNPKVKALKIGGCPAESCEGSGCAKADCLVPWRKCQLINICLPLLALICFVFSNPFSCSAVAALAVGFMTW